VKANTAAELVPVLVTLALDPAAPVVTDPMPMVAAAPGAPAVPAGPVFPVSPLGIEKLRIAALLVPAFETEALDPAAPVTTLPTLTVAAAPAAPVCPVAPVAPGGPLKAN
jgi:hypothetical protein